MINGTVLTLLVITMIISLVSLSFSVKANKSNVVTNQPVNVRKPMATRLVDEPILGDMKKELHQALDGLSFYKQESAEWHNRYRLEQMDHQETKNKLGGQIRDMQSELNNLTYIVKKMDGRVIERDEDQHIVGIRRVK